MNKFLRNILSAKGELSSKRLITLVAFCLMGIGFLANLFWDQTIEVNIYDSMKWIVIGGLGFTASELFSKKGADKSEEEDLPSEEEVK